MGCASTKHRLDTIESGLSEVPGAISCMQEGIIGRNATIRTPYGVKPRVYADYASTGRCLAQIEHFVMTEVMPLYSSTDTNGNAIRGMVEESRHIIAAATNAKADRDVVLFTGGGTTAAIVKIVQSLGLHVPLPEGVDESLRPVVFTSSYEHHSNLLPWRESVADVVTIDLSPVTGVCLTHLREKLQKYQHRKLKIGSFCVASMVTAVNDVAIMMHAFGGIVIFDYSAAAPHVHVDMNPKYGGKGAELVYKDAIVMAGHMFLGGPGSSEILIAKKSIFLRNMDMEDLDTGHALGDIRSGLALKLHASLNIVWIVEQELAISKRVYAAFAAHPNVCVLRSAPANASIPHLPIFSFLIRYSTASYSNSSEGTKIFPPSSRTSRFLHHNFVCAILNDLFGLQSRGGCMGAEPYSYQLLGISAVNFQLLETALLDKVEVLRPGYTRLSLPYWMSTQEIDYVVNAVKFVADHGYKFLSLYEFEITTAIWKSVDSKKSFNYSVMKRFRTPPALNRPNVAAGCEEVAFADSFFAAHKMIAEVAIYNTACRCVFPAKYSDMRWFAMGGDDDSHFEFSHCIVSPSDFDEVLLVHPDFTDTFHSHSLTASPRYLNPDEIVLMPPLSPGAYCESSFETVDTTLTEV